MTELKTATEFIAEYINIFYAITVIGFTWVTLQFLFKSPTAFEKRLWTAIYGAIFFLVWLLWFHETGQILFASFTFSVVAYTWVVKYVMKKLGYKYNNGEGKI